MSKAQLSIEFIILLSVVLFIGSAMILSQVQQMRTFDAYGDLFESQVINEKNALAIQSVSILGVSSSSTFVYSSYDYFISDSSSLLSFSYQNSVSQTAIPGVTIGSQSVSNYSLVRKNTGGFSFE